MRGDQRPGEAGAEQVLALVDCASPQGGERVLGQELLFEVLNIDFGGAGGQRLGLDGSEVVTLADIGGESDDLTAVGLLDPLEDNRGVQTAGVGEDNFLDRGLLRHVPCSSHRSSSVVPGARPNASITPRCSERAANLAAVTCTWRVRAFDRAWPRASSWGGKPRRRIAGSLSGWSGGVKQRAATPEVSSRLSAGVSSSSGPSRSGSKKG